MSTDNERQKFQVSGLKWLQEMEFINHPQMINTIKLNVLMQSERIKDVEFLIYRENRSILVCLHLTWIGRTFFKKSIVRDVGDIVSQLIPSFKYRVIDDRRILELAITKVKNAITGGTQSENASIPNDKLDVVVSSSENSSNTTEPASTENTEPDQKKQSEDR